MKKVVLGLSLCLLGVSLSVKAEAPDKVVETYEALESQVNAVTSGQGNYTKALKNNISRQRSRIIELYNSGVLSKKDYRQYHIKYARLYRQLLDWIAHH